MSEKIITGPESSEKEEAEKSVMEQAAHKWQALKVSIEEGRQAIKAKGRNLLGLDLPHAENGQTIEPLPSEVPPAAQETEVIPSSYGNLPIDDTIPEKPVSLATTGIIHLPTEEVENKPIKIPKLPDNIGGSRRPKEPEKQENLPDYHTIQKGETLYAVAKKYSVGLDTLFHLNGLNENSILEINQKIALKPGIKAPTENLEEPKIPDYHTVKAGQTLYSIAQQYKLDLAQLLQINNLDTSAKLQINQKIALKPGVKMPEQEKKPESEKKLAEGLTKKEHIALILKTCDDLGVTNVAQRAYILATAEHESDYFKTLSEYSKGRLKKYGKIDPSTGHAYYGRGYVQLTWKENYERYDGILKSNGLLAPDQSIVTNPELVKNPKIAAFILVHGMMNGSFGYIEVGGQDRKARLDMFIDDSKRDWEGARYTVNGTDKKRKIAGQAQEILKLLETK